MYITFLPHITLIIIRSFILKSRKVVEIWFQHHKTFGNAVLEFFFQMQLKVNNTLSFPLPDPNQTQDA